MKRIILILISSCAVFFVSAQEEIFSDSIPGILNKTSREQLMIEKPLIFDEAFSTTEMFRIDPSAFRLPLLPDFSKNIDFKKYLNYSNFSAQSFSSVGFGFAPFFTSGMIYNQAVYKINDRFSFGGNSFGAQSVFDLPKINSSIRDMSTKGASMFFQYKFSDKFKVETRVSISNHQLPRQP